VLTITDRIAAEGLHDVALAFHTAETAEVEQVGLRCFEIRVRGGTVRLTLDATLSVEQLRGSEHPIGGWVSRGYHRRTPATTLVGRARGQGPQTLVCRFEVLPQPPGRPAG
jgi:hypothetical protein